MEGKRKFNYLFILLIILSFSSGCFSGQDSKSTGIAQYAPNAPMDDFAEESASGKVSRDMGIVPPSPEPPVSGEIDITDLKIIYSANMRIEVKDTMAAAGQVESIAKGAGGYISNSNFYETSSGQKQGSITIRVPQEGFENVLMELESLGKVKDSNTNAQDVTEEYTDLSARLENLKKQEVRLVEILNMTKTVEEVLDVEGELYRVRGDIESFQGRLNYLNSRIDFSTITISLVEPTIISSEFSLRDIFNQAVAGFLGVTGAIIVVGISIIPLVVLIIVLFYVVRFLRGRRG